VFRESCTRKGICADWVSGDLIAGKGKLVAYAHMGFNRTAEHQVHLKVEKGKVVESSLRRYRKTGGIEKIRAVTYTTLKRNFCEAP
jgi:hypothetical protein